MPEELLVFCTLLGPEGPDLPPSFFGARRLNGPLDPFVDWAWPRREGYRPYFENYTVDASILDARQNHPDPSDWFICDGYHIKQ